MSRSFQWSVLLVAVALLLPVKSSAAVEILVTIKPLQLIAEAVAGEEDAITTLMSAANSPHHFTLSPSDRAAIERADLILYVGEELETQISSIIAQHGSSKAVVAMARLEELTRIPFMANDAAAASRDHRVNPHLWLSTNNAIAMAKTIRDRLSELDSSRVGLFNENTDRFESLLENRSRQWQTGLAALNVGPYMVYHDAIPYFERQFGLQHNLVLVEDPEVTPGIRSILQVRDAVTELNPVCLFTDESAREATIETLLSGKSINTIQLDLLGKNISDGGGYDQLIEKLVEDFESCF